MLQQRKELTRLTQQHQHRQQQQQMRWHILQRFLQDQMVARLLPGVAGAVGPAGVQEALRTKPHQMQLLLLRG
jgi:hypothetical protein